MCAGVAVACLSALALADSGLGASGTEVLPADQVRQLANETLGLADSLLVNLDLDTSPPGQAIAVELPTEDGVLNLELHPHSVRAPGYQLFVVGEDGVQRAVSPGRERTLRGEVVGVPGSVVAASMLDDGLYGRVTLPDGTEYWVEPISDRVYGAARGDHLIYHACDAIRTGATCGADMIDQPNAHAVPLGNQAPADDTYRGTSEICTAQLACDTDVQYYNRYGSVSAVENQINAVINSMNSQYETEVGLTHEITAIIVRTAEPDPYTTTDSGSFLSQFRDEWLTNQGSIPRDLAELFTGKNLDGSVIGIAYLAGVCNSVGYSVVQSDFTTAFSCKTDLSAHELGHNWNASHCSCPSNTMNPSITCANSFHPTLTRPTIINYKGQVSSCLQCGPPMPVYTTCVNVNAKGATTIQSGGPAEAQNSDDQYVEAISGYVNGHQRANMVFFMDGSQTTVSQIDVKTEVAASTTGTHTHVYLRQFPDNGLPQVWVQLGVYDQPLTDTVSTWTNVADPNLYVKDVNGRIHVRVFTNKRNTPVNFIQYIDQVQVYSVP